MGLFGEGWCASEFAWLGRKIKESLLSGLAKRSTPLNVWGILAGAEHALVKLGPVRLAMISSIWAELKV